MYSNYNTFKLKEGSNKIEACHYALPISPLAQVDVKTSYDSSDTMHCHLLSI